jgi:peroxiredoxin
MSIFAMSFSPPPDCRNYAFASVPTRRHREIIVHLLAPKRCVSVVRQLDLSATIDAQCCHATARSRHAPEKNMTIKVGDRLPPGTLSEYIDVETEGCKIGPNQFPVDALTRGKKVVIFGLPGAFTPTCSAQHVPSYVRHYDELKAKGVDDIFCLSVNDAFVMGAWAKNQNAAGKVRMMGDGSAAYTKALGLELDLTARGMGVRCQRFSALVEDGVVTALNIEAPGKFEVSGAEPMLKQLG